MPLSEPVAKIGFWLIEHIRDWGWAVVGWFKPEAQRQRQMHRLLSSIGDLRAELMREPTNSQYEALVRRAEAFGRTVVDFHNRDTTERLSPALPLEAARVPDDAKHNTREGRTGFAFWLDWHRQQLLYRRDGPPSEKRRRLPDERRGG